MDTIRCVECQVQKAPELFNERIRDSKKGKKGEKYDRCAKCVDRAKVRRMEKAKEDGKAQGKGKKREMDGSGSEDEDGVNELDVVDLEDFVHAVQELSSSETVCISARVDVSKAAPQVEESKERANHIAKVLGNFMKLHWK